MQIAAVVALVICFAATPVLADWHPQNPNDQAAVKMHFPQLPDPTGWDIEIGSFNNQHEIADFILWVAVT
jgi:hypothetical protein